MFKINRRRHLTVPHCHDRNGSFDGPGRPEQVPDRSFDGASGHRVCRGTERTTNRPGFSDIVAAGTGAVSVDVIDPVNLETRALQGGKDGACQRASGFVKIGDSRRICGQGPTCHSSQGPGAPLRRMARGFEH